MKETVSTSGLDVVLIEKIENRLKSTAHPMRIAIIELLLEKGKLSVTQIYEQLKIEQASASNHLRILKENGVLGSTRDGQKIIYSVKTKSLKNIVDFVNRFLAI